MPGFHLPNIGIKEKIPGREVLIDADCVAYWAAAGQDELPLRAATLRADQRMQQILAETQSEKYCAYLTGERNFIPTLSLALAASMETRAKRLSGGVPTTF